jgi:hypothetical protein
MMAYKGYISSLVVLAVVFQSLFVANGLLGICIMESKELCTCNHSSKKEIHSNPEDTIFIPGSKQKQVIQYKFQKPQANTLADQDISHKSHHEGESAKVLPNCHSAKSGELHLCSCKKQKQSAESLNPHLQSFYTYTAYSISKPLFQIEILRILNRTILLSGSTEDHFKPPKLNLGSIS